MHEIDRSPKCCLQLGEALFGGGEIDRSRIPRPADRPSRRAGLRRARGRRASTTSSSRLERNGAGVDRLAAGRLLAQLRDVHVAEIGQHQRARDRRRGQHQHVDGLALAREREPLVHAEAMLLVDDGEREVAECDVVLEQRMGADQQIDLAEREALEDVAALAAALAAGEDRDADAGGFGERRDGVEMLAREDFGRRHQRRLPAGLDHASRPRAAPPRSCRSRHRPAAAAACAAGLARSATMSSTARACDGVSE